GREADRAKVGAADQDRRPDDDEPPGHFLDRDRVRGGRAGDGQGSLEQAGGRGHGAGFETLDGQRETASGGGDGAGSGNPFRGGERAVESGGIKRKSGRVGRE